MPKQQTPDQSQLPEPPIAEKIPVTITVHGDSRIDEYHWMRNKEDPKVIAYLNAENTYTEAVFAPYQKVRDQLFDEMKARLKEDEADVPVRIDEYYYYSRYETGHQYPVHCRKHRSLDAEEEVIPNENELAAGKTYFALGTFTISPDHSKLLISIDDDGSEKYTLKIKDLRSGHFLAENIPGSSGSAVWAEDNATIFYCLLDDNHRPDRLFRHKLGTNSKDDALIYTESDPQLFVYCGKSRSRRCIFLEMHGKVTSEYWFIEASKPESEFRIIEPRRTGTLYSVEHHNESFFILTNDTGPNFRLCETPMSAPGREQWNEKIPTSETHFLESIDAFAHHLVIEERVDGLPQIRVIDLRGWNEHRIMFEEAAYSVSGLSNPEFKTKEFRFYYTSMVTPGTVFDYDLDARTRQIKKVQEIPSGYDRNHYHSERIYATATDGKRIPISLVYRKDMSGNDMNTTDPKGASFKRDGSHPVYLYGYGAYGINIPASFSTARLSLLDRGFVYAIAHIRGGSDMGRPWYEDAKFLTKKNTFNDFIACAEHLIKENFTKAGQIVISGGSAGGMLVGTVINQRPELFRGAIAEVPFVDVLNTMLDASLPLTPLEYEEWGNPEDPAYYHYIKSYSPYDNVEPKHYPHLFVTGGLNDPRVTYWEPTKWVARLRDLKKDQNLLLLHMNMDVGHGGASGRYESLKEIALEYLFVLRIFNLLDSAVES